MSYTVSGFLSPGFTSAVKLTYVASFALDITHSKMESYISSPIVPLCNIAMSASSKIFSLNV